MAARPPQQRSPKSAAADSQALLRSELRPALPGMAEPLLGLILEYDDDERVVLTNGRAVYEPVAEDLTASPDQDVHVIDATAHFKKLPMRQLVLTLNTESSRKVVLCVYVCDGWDSYGRSAALVVHTNGVCLDKIIVVTHRPISEFEGGIKVAVVDSLDRARARRRFKLRSYGACTGYRDVETLRPVSTSVVFATPLDPAEHLTPYFDGKAGLKGRVTSPLCSHRSFPKHLSCALRMPALSCQPSVAR